MRKGLFSILILVIMIWVSVFTVDYYRCGHLQSPIFVIAGDDVADDGGTGSYYGLGYRVNIYKEIDSEYGVTIVSVEMIIFDKVISASIQ